VYIPLGGSRCETWKIVRNMAVVWFLTGMWHGASWNYILWGLYYLGFLLLERFVFKMEWKPVWKHLYTLFIICIGWTIFRFENLGELVTVLLGMVHIGNASFLGLDASTVFTSNIFFMIFAMIACTDIGKLLRKIGYVLGQRNTICLHLFAVTEMITPLFLLILAVLALIGNSYNPFLYFQF
ncbi:MAG: MBOAT family protein, partial [Erysipelotrichaceae bacterium]|nr:MBOAT family protein [Erysipelotrichaceae bacterium]